MSTTIHSRHGDEAQPDLRLPDHRREPEQAVPAPLRVLGAICGAAMAAVVAVIFLVMSPLVGLAAGAGRIMMEVRENAARPRPFVGARHGFPFLDPPVRAATEPPTTAQKE